ncbi:MAG: hypothetical protein KGZ42_07670 [Melioribacter sp.]|nr:hypothetical protein [Melioribacter sp.]
MKYQFISFDELQNRLEKIEDIEERIEKLSFEIFQCSNWIPHLKNGLKNLAIQQIEFRNCTPDLNQEVSEAFQNNNTIKENCSKYLVTLITDTLTEPLNEFLEQAKQLLQYYSTLADIKDRKIDKRNGAGKTSTNNKIIWKAGKESLIKIFDVLRQNEFLPEYKKNKILVHFCSEKHKCFCNANGEITPLSWKDSDCTFAIFVDELAKRGAINDNNKFKIFSEHFVNQQGDPFKDLAQKRNFTDNTTNTGGFIRNILKEISFSVLLLIFHPFISLYITLC